MPQASGGTAGSVPMAALATSPSFFSCLRGKSQGTLFWKLCRCCIMLTLSCISLCLFFFKKNSHENHKRKTIILAKGMLIAVSLLAGITGLIDRWWPMWQSSGIPGTHFSYQLIVSSDVCVLLLVHCSIGKLCQYSHLYSDYMWLGACLFLLFLHFWVLGFTPTEFNTDWIEHHIYDCCTLPVLQECQLGCNQHLNFWSYE